MRVMISHGSLNFACYARITGVHMDNSTEYFSNETWLALEHKRAFAARSPRSASCI